MKRLQSMLVLMIFALCSITTLAQTALDKSLLTTVTVDAELLTTANLELSKVAQDNGYLLKTDATHFSPPESNLFVPINITTAFHASIATGMAVGAILFYLTGGTNSLFGIIPIMKGATLAIVLDAVAAGSASVVAGHRENYVLFVDHLRTELHYEVVDSDSDETLEGSCLYFFSVDREESSLSYEIDSCTHDNVFPENEEGVLRIGEDGPDFWDWGQTDVVANGNISFASLQVLGL